MTSKKLSSFVAAAGAVVVLMAAMAPNASADSGATCTGGPVAPGVYSSLNITGACFLTAGKVMVQHNLTVLPGASLVGVAGGFGGGGSTLPPSPDLTVNGNLDVQANATLTLGCEPIAFNCSNDTSGFPGTLFTRDSIGGNLTAENAYQVVVHHTAIGGNVTVSGGGGGLTCANFQYGDFEDDIIGGNLTITGWQSCWLGFFRTTIMHNARFDGNTTADPDGNEIANNTILGTLSCSGNSPSPQTGDSLGGPSVVVGNASGQCNSPGMVIP